MVNITVSKKDHNLTEREQKFLEVLLLNLSAHANAYCIKEGMAINPIEKQDFQLFNYQFAWQHSISKELFDEFIEAIQTRFDTAFKMCGLEDIKVHLVENAYSLIP